MNTENGNSVSISSYVGRLAPSPTGALHLGNARTFLIAWLRCRSLGGRLIYRMEDLDHPKVKPWAIEQTMEDLKWLGLDWDEGPDIGGKNAPYTQTQRIAYYRAAFEKLRAAKLIYPCTCTRADIENARSAPHEGEELRYPNTCRGRYVSAKEAREAAGREPAWRFKVPQGETAFSDVFYGRHVSRLDQWSGDFTIARSPDMSAYQLAVVVDDATMGVTEVIRGDDLMPSTHRQIALYRALMLEVPKFLHLPLVVGPDGRRLAKRHGDTRVSHIREAGTSPERVIGWLAYTCGLVKYGEELMPEKLVERFSLDLIPRKRVVVDDEVKSFMGVQ